MACTHSASKPPEGDQWRLCVLMPYGCSGLGKGSVLLLATLSIGVTQVSGRCLAASVPYGGSCWWVSVLTQPQTDWRTVRLGNTQCSAPHLSIQAPLVAVWRAQLVPQRRKIKLCSVHILQLGGAAGGLAPCWGEPRMIAPEKCDKTEAAGGITQWERLKTFRTRAFQGGSAKQTDLTCQQSGWLTRLGSSAVWEDYMREFTILPTTRSVLQSSVLNKKHVVFRKCCKKWKDRLLKTFQPNF